MHFDKLSFGTLRIDGSAYEQDLVIDRGEIHNRKKMPSKKFRDEFGHTPLSIEEEIPWKCHRLVIGTGAYGRMPVMKEVKLEAERGGTHSRVTRIGLIQNPQADSAIGLFWTALI
jgi:hypothetical protein